LWEAGERDQLEIRISRLTAEEEPNRGTSAGKKGKKNHWGLQHEKKTRKNKHGKKTRTITAEKEGKYHWLCPRIRCK